MPARTPKGVAKARRSAPSRASRARPAPPGKRKASLNIPPELVNAVKQRRVVLFAGAGISQEALGGLNGWTVQETLGKEIKKAFPNYDYKLRSFEDVCDEYEVLNGHMALVQRLAGLIPKNRSPLASHLAAAETFRFIVTTNWDLLFEAAYQHLGLNYQILVREADAPGFGFDQYNLLKIHGSADTPLTLVARSEDYGVYSETHKEMLKHVEHLLYTNTVLFVGYGLRDPHMQHLLAQIRHRRGQWALKAYVVGQYDDVRTKLLAARKMEVLPHDAKEFLPELKRLAGM